MSEHRALREGRPGPFPRRRPGSLPPRRLLLTAVLLAGLLAGPVATVGPVATAAYAASVQVTPRQTDPAGESSVPASTAQPNQSVSDARRRADEDERRVWYTVAGLVLVALLLFILTIVYWRRTRPVDTTRPRHARKGRSK